MGTVSVPSSTPVSFQGLQMGIFAFWTERDWSRKSCYGNTIEGVIFSFVMHIYGAKFQENCFNISRDIVYLVFYHF